MSKDYVLSVDDLKQHLEEQKQLLIISVENFDNGIEIEAKRMATSLRILLCDTKKQLSLLGQLNLLNGYFLSAAEVFSEKHLQPYHGLVFARLSTKNSRYVAMLDDSHTTRWIPFTQWWSEPIFVAKDKFIFSREDLVRSIADQDGGTHVDPKLRAAYAELSKYNAINFEGDRGKLKNKPELVAIRQIAHEILRSLIPDYRKKCLTQEGDVMSIGDMIME